MRTSWASWNSSPTSKTWDGFMRLSRKTPFIAFLVAFASGEYSPGRRSPWDHELGLLPFRHGRLSPKPGQVGRGLLRGSERERDWPLKGHDWPLKGLLQAMIGLRQANLGGQRLKDLRHALAKRFVKAVVESKVSFAPRKSILFRHLKAASL